MQKRIKEHANWPQIQGKSKKQKIATKRSKVICKARGEEKREIHVFWVH